MQENCITRVQHECQRLVSIAAQTSQSQPKIFYKFPGTPRVIQILPQASRFVSAASQIRFRQSAKPTWLSISQFLQHSRATPLPPLPFLHLTPTPPLPSFLLLCLCFNMGVRQRSGKSSKQQTSLTKSAAQCQPPPAPKSFWQKAIARDAQLTPEEALKAIHWIRQAAGLIIGTIFGVAQFKGALAILTFFFFSLVGAPALLSVTNELDIEEISQVAPIQMEGLWPSFALFLLSWIITYTVFLPPTAQLIRG